MKYLKVIELIHCSNRSFMGSQFIFSNSVKPIWALLSKFRQKRMHLFWSICNLDFNYNYNIAKGSFILKGDFYFFDNLKVFHEIFSCKVKYFVNYIIPVLNWFNLNWSGTIKKEVYIFGLFKRYLLAALLLCDYAVL